MTTQQEVAAGASALEAYVDKMLAAKGEMFEEWFIPNGVYSTGASDALKAADGASDQSQAGRQQAAFKALRAALDATGQGGQVTDDECNSGAAAVLAAVAKIRASST